MTQEEPTRLTVTCLDCQTEVPQQNGYVDLVLPTGSRRYYFREWSYSESAVSYQNPETGVTSPTGEVAALHFSRQAENGVWHTTVIPWSSVYVATTIGNSPGVDTARWAHKRECEGRV